MTTSAEYDATKIALALPWSAMAHERGLTDLWRTVSMPGTEPTAEVFQILVQDEWTTDLLAIAVEYAVHAIDYGVTDRISGFVNPTVGHLLRGIVLRTRERIECGGGPVAAALGWIALAVAAPGGPRFYDIDVVLASPEEAESVVAAWASVPSGVAPWAYAAGLTPEETLARHTADTLDVADLKMLAALRGYRLADLPLA